MVMHILHVVGARPNFMKVAPVLSALGERRVRQTLVHTGQHYDVNLSDAIFRELQIPAPDVNLGVGSGSHAEQTANVMVGMEQCLAERKPDLVLVYGDVNSTVAATLVAAKACIPVGHVEAGLRSGDRAMPEEINRIVTDRLATWLFTPSADGDENLRREGVAPNAIRLVGNVMIDTLIRLLPIADPEPLLARFGLVNGHGPQRYALVTLHRPSNVDDPTMLHALIQTLDELASHLPIVFPIHPRTRGRLNGQARDIKRLILTEPLTYLQFLAMQRHAAVVITDSGGIQEETTYLGVPCLTVRENTERPVTISVGTNQLIGRDTSRLREEALKILSGSGKRGAVPPLWDGHASDRIAAHLA
ncbi:MAG TPA: UDP-N-acetylglucosamine 2-epimerase (non-hydrolyzing) [Vicinamibacterales bacterium]|nr:UDP-N-acetylglucosamine 2-epimerase (non-hydrolyzing) [Vicinamibacterales bacterium]